MFTKMEPKNNTTTHSIGDIKRSHHRDINAHCLSAVIVYIDNFWRFKIIHIILGIHKINDIKRYKYIH
jgi:hypothetical protein